MKKKTTVKMTQEKKAQPGQLLHACERRSTMVSPQGTMDGSHSGRFTQPGQSCMIVGVIDAQLAGEQMKLYGFMRTGAASLEWIMLPSNKAQSFWAA